VVWWQATKGNKTGRSGKSAPNRKVQEEEPVANY